MESLAGPQEPVERLCHVWTYMDPARLQRVWIQGYNAQAAVDGAKQISVAHALTQSMSDCPQLVPLVDAVRANLGRKPREISADAGYCSEDNLLVLATRKIHAYVVPGEPSIRPRPRARSGRTGYALVRDS